MKLAIFGSTGKVGLQLVKQAIALGHQVTAHTRHPEKLTQIDQENLRIEKGDVLDIVSVQNAIRRQDVIICALGMPLMNKDGLRTKGTKNIIEAMESTGVKRLVCLSGLGTGESFSTLPFHYRHLIFPFVLKHVLADHETQEIRVKESDLDWTIARPANFAKGSHTGAYQHGFSRVDQSLKLKISPADVADFMLKQVSDNTYLHQTPALSY
ncbi:epimerase [Alphaproteobacteria bacterium 46_93_T64]|nr:epimerase [Alphaproteobacteria bacterium 46_93_T64]